MDILIALMCLVNLLLNIILTIKILDMERVTETPPKSPTSKPVDFSKLSVNFEDPYESIRERKNIINLMERKK